MDTQVETCGRCGYMVGAWMPVCTKCSEPNPGYVEEKDAAALVSRIRGKVAEYGTQKDAARAFGVSASYLSDVLKGRREPGEKLCAALGYRRVVSYEPAAPPQR